MVKVLTGQVLSQLRKLFDSKYTPVPIHAYIVYSNDSHMSEYTSIHDQRRKYITGFGGSAGTAIVTEKEAYLWTDGRYFLEAESSIDENWTLMKQGMKNTPTIIEWLQSLPPGLTIGTDPKYISFVDWKNLHQALVKTGKSLTPVMQNLVDIVWKENGKTSEILSTPYVYEISHAGLSWQDKVKKVRQAMKEKNAGVLVLSALDETAWLFNLRGHDIECSPLFKAYSIISTTDIYLFLPEVNLPAGVSSHLNINSPDAELPITIMPYSSAILSLKELSKNFERVWINDKTPASLALELPKEKILMEINPVTIFKAVKNSAEISNLKIACTRDAACLCQYFGKIKNSLASTVIDEITGAEMLHSIRTKMPDYVMNSFETISSVGSNAAIIHYRPSRETVKIIDVNQLYLCDSGAQYLDGTTDITRTLHFGTPTEYEKECYTLVLKGQIAIGKAVFPEGSKGSRIDSFARSHLWSHGLDYMHGTGHGIGMFLNVHEGPQCIGSNLSDYPLEPGNVLSDEPGYYEDGKFGIRLENMMFVKKLDTKYRFKNLQFLGFEMLSFVPYHLSLINTSMLTAEEIAWLNDFNQTCVNLIKPELEKWGFSDGLEYLVENTKNIS